MNANTINRIVWKRALTDIPSLFGILHAVPNCPVVDLALDVLDLSVVNHLAGTPWLSAVAAECLVPVVTLAAALSRADVGVEIQPLCVGGHAHRQAVVAVAQVFDPSEVRVAGAGSVVVYVARPGAPAPAWLRGWRFWPSECTSCCTWCSPPRAVALPRRVSVNDAVERGTGGGCAVLRCIGTDESWIKLARFCNARF